MIATPIMQYRFRHFMTRNAPLDSNLDYLISLYAWIRACTSNIQIGMTNLETIIVLLARKIQLIRQQYPRSDMAPVVNSPTFPSHHLPVSLVIAHMNSQSSTMADGPILKQPIQKQPSHVPLQIATSGLTHCSLQTPAVNQLKPRNTNSSFSEITL